MTEPTSTAPASMTPTLGGVASSAFTVPEEPDYLEHLFRARGLKALYWRVGDPTRLDEDDPNPQATIVAPLAVVFSNGRRHFVTDAVLDTDIIYGLVGQDEISRASAEFAIDQLLGHAGQLVPEQLEWYATHEDWAAAISTWTHSDADLLRSAAEKIEGEWAELLRTAAEIVDRIEPGTSFADPDVQLAAVAVKIAWDLL